MVAKYFILGGVVEGKFTFEKSGRTINVYTDINDCSNSLNGHVYEAKEDGVLVLMRKSVPASIVSRMEFPAQWISEATKKKVSSAISKISKKY